LDFVHRLPCRSTKLTFSWRPYTRTRITTIRFVSQNLDSRHWVFYNQEIHRGFLILRCVSNTFLTQSYCNCVHRSSQIIRALQSCRYGSLTFLGNVLPNESMPFIVLLGKVIVFSLFHIHQQNRVRSVNALMRITSTPDFEVRCWVALCVSPRMCDSH
jgi:hypothetical protein